MVYKAVEIADCEYKLVLYAAVTLQGNAKSLYLVTDGDLKRMGCLTKQNPQHKQWTAMKLYLQRQA